MKVAAPRWIEVKIAQMLKVKLGYSQTTINFLRVMNGLKRR